MGKRAILFVMVLLCAYLIPGCMFVSPDFKHTRNLILAELGPVDVDTEVQLRIGPGLLSCAGLVVSFTDADEEAVSYLHDVKNVEVGVYNLKNTRRDKPFAIPDKVRKSLAKKGYEPLVRVKDGNEATWVMTKIRGKRLEAMYVIVVDKEELVLVEVRGRLERLIAKAIEEHGFNKKDFSL